MLSARNQLKGTVKSVHLGNVMAASMVMAGAYAAATELVGLAALEEAVGEALPSYREIRYSHPLATLVREASERAWVNAPVLGGAAFRLTRPRRLLELLRWADAVLVEFPWQFEHCRRQRPEARLVYASHNVEAQKFASYQVPGWPWHAQPLTEIGAMGPPTDQPAYEPASGNLILGLDAFQARVFVT